MKTSILTLSLLATGLPGWAASLSYKPMPAETFANIRTLMHIQAEQGQESPLTLVLPFQREELSEEQLAALGAVYARFPEACNARLQLAIQKPKSDLEEVRKKDLEEKGKVAGILARVYLDAIPEVREGVRAEARQLLRDAARSGALKPFKAGMRKLNVFGDLYGSDVQDELRPIQSAMEAIEAAVKAHTTAVATSMAQALLEGDLAAQPAQSQAPLVAIDESLGMSAPIPMEESNSVRLKLKAAKEASTGQEGRSNVIPGAEESPAYHQARLILAGGLRNSWPRVDSLADYDSPQRLDNLVQLLRENTKDEALHLFIAERLDRMPGFGISKKTTAQLRTLLAASGFKSVQNKLRETSFDLEAANRNVATNAVIGILIILGCFGLGFFLRIMP